jgi:hypothetical protein
MTKKPTKNSDQLDFFLKQITKAKNLLTFQNLGGELTIKQVTTPAETLKTPKTLKNIQDTLAFPSFHKHLEF